MEKRRFSLESPLSRGSHNSPENTSTSTLQSALLQDLLREKKAQTRRNDSFTGSRPQRHELETRALQISPLAAPAARERPNPSRRRSNAVAAKDASVPNEMGLRETDEVNFPAFNLFQRSTDELMVVETVHVEIEEAKLRSQIRTIPPSPTE